MARRNTPTASPPATRGEGCLARFDPDALSAEDGTEFPGAAELWQALNPPAADSAPPSAALQTVVRARGRSNN
ncbi:hypothetical protein [Pseudomonas sp. UFMG81]|jgi:hypothetical protein|uniref:hypothetical protein n=1 Tax=Pseudomonas sp. UFMG81 TaxID=2745936 RepID=UPI001E4F05DD|nr:hypothetical protein [Pseudomonas sp. UFMG81]